jgi:nicotinamidase-related amidase
MLTINNSALLVIDVQGKLAQVMVEKEELLANLSRMSQGAQILGLPILWLEQVPEKLGPTVPELAEILSASSRPIAKSTFSGCGASNFIAQLQQLERSQILLTGIEAHVCVYQTGVDLIERGYEVHVVTDAVSSRSLANKSLALARLNEAGAILTGSEMALFELLGKAEGDAFRAISRLVK